MPPVAKPSWLLPGKYKPVVVSPVKFKDGAGAEPLPSVNVVAVLIVAVCALYTLMPSQITMIVCDCARVTVLPLPDVVLNVSVNDPVVLFCNE